ncbi:AGE family epimerase/isomerase [Saccharopolyspora sp. TS4A08]|uniref:AGE family epimerase/isomerase n=1 Tax=Saccharopolyspora ipomoeae TaxID=3042027 RepID=A0ABT6PIJ9_9PSEU|nr:AGE family epimerase/isomerase [Saccharopolyspora sp. TS4A08]MDI2027473.1 AGE family epimerase/isomerase [Saccharopolyspora sp. TS4A08]
MTPHDPPTADWLRKHRAELRRFALNAVHPEGGFAWLDDTGSPELDHDVELWITCRMTHVFALGVLEGDDSCAAALDHGVAALRGRLRDERFGGWFAGVNRRGPTVADKEAYGHAFVVLAATSAVAAGHPDGEALLADALAVHDERFWRPADGLVVDNWNRDWTGLDPYRGVNANMHTVEALLACGDVTGDRARTERAAGIVERVVHGFAAGNDYRLPEHFSTEWEPLLDYNRDKPADKFRPYGVTIGHLLEWARLALNVRTALGESAPEWLLDDARALFDLAVREGWDVDGAEGFVYTTDFSGRPVVRDRLHWVVTEAIAAAWALHSATGDAVYERWYGEWWAHAQRHFLDGTGSWHHELDATNQPASTVWEGKPDVYHAYQAALLPELDSAVSFAGAARRLNA